MFGLTKAEPRSSTLQTHKILTEDAACARTREQELEEAGIRERELKLSGVLQAAQGAGAFRNNSGAVWDLW